MQDAEVKKEKWPVKYDDPMCSAHPADVMCPMCEPLNRPPFTEKEVSTSPVPEVVEEKKETLTFPEAIKEVMIGKRMQRLEWHDSEYAMIKNMNGEDYLIIHHNEKDDVWMIRMPDLQADDYVVF